MEQALDKTIMKFYPNWQDTNDHDVDAMEQMMVRVQRRAFKNGIDWYANNLWHNCREIPTFNKNTSYFVDNESRYIVTKNGCYIESHIVTSIYDWKQRFYNKVDAWAYLEDILPTNKEEQQ